MNTKSDRLSVARALAHQGQYDKAQSLCQQVEKNGKRPIEVAALLALTLALKGDVEAARERLLKLQPPGEFVNVDSLVDAGSAWLKLDVPQAGLAYFGEAIRRNPADPLANARLGAALSALGRFDDALPYLEKARDLWPKVGGVRLNLARAYGRIEGSVIHVSQDSVINKDAAPGTGPTTYYTVRVATSTDHFGTADMRYDLTPGVQVTAGIVTGSRSVLAYLLYPIFRTMPFALTER